MSGTDKVKKIIFLILQLATLFLLMTWLQHGGVGVLLGKEIGNIALMAIIKVGIVVMILPSILFSLLLPTRRYMVLRDTQIQVFKYLGWMTGFQLLGSCLMNIAGGTAIATLNALSPYIMHMIVMSLAFMAIGMPLKYCSNLFNQAKAIQFRNPSSIIKQFYK